jgi:butyryl-CoA dehydrogenase
VHGGYGYTRDFPVEQYWRDNRLNMIHEGTHGIQALDLLGRKVTMQKGAGLAAVAARMQSSIDYARLAPELAGHADKLAAALEHLITATRGAWSTGDPIEALANATPYLQAFGHVVLAWMWLELATTSQARIAAGDARADFFAGKRAACDYFLAYELPRIDAWLGVVETRDPTCRMMRAEWF